MQLSRRDLLRWGSLSAVGAAGCIGGDGDETAAETGTPGGGDAATESPTDTATATATPTETAAETPTATPDCEAAVSGTIESDETWGDGCSRVRLEGDVAVIDAATLTIRPGTTVIASRDVRFDVHSGGILKAEGSESAPIRFRGNTEVPGHWQGIGINSNAPNVVSNVVVEHAGDRAVIVGGRVRLTDTVVRQSSGVGMEIDGHSEIEAFANNTLEQNEGVGLEIDSNAVGDLDEASTYAAGNGEDYIHVYTNGVEEDQTWPAPSAPYFLEDSFAVSADLEIAPGAEFVAGKETEITVGDGSLAAVGEPDAEISFHAPEDVPGYWGGITFQTRNPNNRLEHVTVAHAWDGNVTVNGYLSVVESTFRRNSGAGFVANGTLREFSGNAFEDNQGVPIRIAPNTVGALDSDSTYAGGNETDRIRVDGDWVDSDQTWSATDAPFELPGLDVNAKLSIDGGAALVFQKDTNVEVDEGENALTVGGGEDPVTFRGKNPAPGYWNGITVRSNSPDNELDNADVGHSEMGVYVDEGRATVTDSHFHDITGDGVIVDEQGTLDASGNSFENVDGENVHRAG